MTVATQPREETRRGAPTAVPQEITQKLHKHDLAQTKKTRQKLANMNMKVVRAMPMFLRVH